MNRFIHIRVVFSLLKMLLLIVSVVACAESIDPPPVDDDKPIDLESHTYEIPVIFHVLYADAADDKQYVPQSRFPKIIKRVNQIYKGTFGGEDVNLKFKLAASDPNGTVLKETGVNRVKARGEYPIDAEKLLLGTEYKDILWDAHEYINIVVFNFSDRDVLGISHMPFMYDKSSNVLQGINTASYDSITLDNLNFTYCSVINSEYIYDQSDGVWYYATDVNCTLAHELGHYLGLLHVFSEDEDGELLENEDDSDFCDDTPSYNRVAYLSHLDELLSGDYLFEDLLTRTNSEGSFQSDNSMDYSYSMSNCFTLDQKERIRTVLRYGLLTPGPKEFDDTRSGSAPEGVLDITPKIIKCR